MKNPTYLSIIWRIFRICMKLSKEDREELKKIVDERDEVAFDFFLKHHWRAI